MNSRIAVLSLFGMVNWIYTWHNPRIDADATDLARQMSQVFLNGVLQGETPKSDSESKSTGREAPGGNLKIKLKEGVHDGNHDC